MNNPKQIAQKFVEISIYKTQNKWHKTVLLAVLAGMFVALGGVASTIAAFSYEGTAANFVKGAVFPVGLAMVVIAGSELFTGNCLIFTGVLAKKVKVSKMTKNLALVFFGNFLGSIVIAALVVYGRVFDSADMWTALIKTAEAKSSLSFGVAFLRAIPCNILVCISVWMMQATDNVAGKILAMYLPILAFVVCGFEHCVANMYYFFAALFAKTIYAVPQTFASFNFLNAFLNMVSVTLGNIVGGMVFVALPYWALYLKGDHETTATKQ